MEQSALEFTPYSYRVFIDFDGTITEKDVGYEMFKHFTDAKTEPLVERYRRGEVNSLECLSGECDIWNSCLPNAGEVERYLEQQPLRPGFHEFLDYLESTKTDPLILSEGFDFYIDRMLKSHNLSRLDRITNVAVYSEGILKPSFPYSGDGCGSCSNCKGHHISKLRNPKSCAIFIGDGHSDSHASQAADIVFARSFLSEMMSKSDNYFIPYNDFIDVKNAVRIIFAESIFTYSARLAFEYFSEKHQNSFRKLWECGDVMRDVGYPNGLGWSDKHYREHFDIMRTSESAIYLGIRNRKGEFMGEAKIAFPDRQGNCHHDLKLMPGFWGKGFAFEAWSKMLDRAGARWPNTKAAVTPSIDNERAIDLYLKLGFQFDGEAAVWTPSDNEPGAVPIQCRKMTRRQN